MAKLDAHILREWSQELIRCLYMNRKRTFFLVQCSSARLHSLIVTLRQLLDLAPLDVCVCVWVGMSVCVCVWERGRERDRTWKMCIATRVCTLFGPQGCTGVSKTNAIRILTSSAQWNVQRQTWKLPCTTYSCVYRPFSFLFKKKKSKKENE